MINDIGQANGAKTMILKMLHYNEKKRKKNSNDQNEK